MILIQKQTGMNGKKKENPEINPCTDSQSKNTEEGVAMEVWRLDGQDNLVDRILKEPSIFLPLTH